MLLVNYCIFGIFTKFEVVDTTCIPPPPISVLLVWPDIETWDVESVGVFKSHLTLQYLDPVHPVIKLEIS